MKREFVVDQRQGASSKAYVGGDEDFNPEIRARQGANSARFQLTPEDERVSGLMAAVRTTHKSARNVSNEDLRTICFEALQAGHNLRSAWLLQKIEAAIPKETAPAAPPSSNPAPFVNPHLEPRPDDGRAKEKERAAAASSPQEKRHERKETKLVLPKEPRRPKVKLSDPLTQLRPSSSEEDASASVESAANAVPLNQDDNAEKKADPIALFIPTHISMIRDREHLEEIAKVHADWKASILNPRLHGSQGRANFRGLDLRGLDFSGLDFSYADFSDAQLQGANLSGANLMRCNFTKANLSDANLGGSRLKRCSFVRANLKGASLQNAQIDEADFAWASGYRPDGASEPSDSGDVLPDAQSSLSSPESIT